MKKEGAVYGYTFLAMISYQLPMGIAFLAKVFISRITRPGTSCIPISLPVQQCFRFGHDPAAKGHLRQFIVFILHYQALFCLVVAAYMSYALGDQRHIAPIGCLLVLIFVFVQSAFAVSFIYIVMEVALYIAASYVGIRVYNQPGLAQRGALHRHLCAGVPLHGLHRPGYAGTAEEDQARQFQTQISPFRA